MILYHYTDQSGFMGIIANKEFWATKIEYFNDENEHNLACRLAKEHLEELLKTTEEPKMVSSSGSDKTTFSMSLRDMPIAARDKFKRLKEEGKVTGSFNNYLRQAVLDKLKQDDI